MFILCLYLVCRELSSVIMHPCFISDSEMLAEFYFTIIARCSSYLIHFSFLNSIYSYLFPIFTNLNFI